MARRDLLILNMSKLQEELNVDFGKSEVYEDIYNSDSLLLYKYVTLLHLEDLQKAQKYIERNIDNPNYDTSSLETAKEAIISEEGMFKLLYKSEEQFEGIACLPVDAKFEEIMLAHKNDLEGIFDVTEDSVKNYSEVINKTIFNLDEENEEIKMDNSEIKRLNKEAFEEKVETPSLEEDIESSDELIDRYDTIKKYKEGKSKDEDELLADIAEMIEEEQFDIADELIDDLESAYLSSSNGELQIFDIEPNEAEIEAASDERLTEIIEEANEEFSNDEVTEIDEDEMTDDEFDELGF